MALYRGIYRIEPARLEKYDYASPGFYHVVVCTADRQRFFGDVRDGEMVLSELGREADRCCRELPDHSRRASLVAYVVMPNHVHLLISLQPAEEMQEILDGQPNRFGPLRTGSLPSVVHALKGAVTRWARRNGHPEFAWQPRYYDRVVRTERELEATRDYIEANPTNWHKDRLHEP